MTIKKQKKYRTYSYSGLDPIISEVRWRVLDARKSGVTIREISDASSASTSTLYNYMSKKKRGSCRHDTVAAILGAFGAHIVVKGGKTLVREEEDA